MGPRRRRSITCAAWTTTRCRGKPSSAAPATLPCRIRTKSCSSANRRGRPMTIRLGFVGPHVRLALSVLLVGVICHLSTQIGFAHKFPPHYISPLWPTGAILFSVMVATPVRHWWAYTLAAYFTSVVNDGLAGFPLAGFLFLV